MITLINKYDWFSPILGVMQRVVPSCARRVLEIGSFEGLSARFFMEHCPNATLTCVDHFMGGEDQQGLDIVGLRDRFMHNTSEYWSRIEMVEKNSWDAWPDLKTGYYDVVFVDGSHVASDVLSDLVGSYRVTKPGGIIVADDYSWENHRPDCPKVAIDAFIQCFAGKVETIEIDRVLAMRKLC